MYGCKVARISLISPFFLMVLKSLSMKHKPLEVNVPINVDLMLLLYKCAQQTRHRQTIREILAAAIHKYSEAMERETTEIKESEYPSYQNADIADSDRLLLNVGAVLTTVDRLLPEIQTTGVPIGKALEQALAHWLDAIKRMSSLDIPIAGMDEPKLLSILRNVENDTIDNTEDETSLCPETSSRRSVQVIRVHFPDGYEIAERIAADTFSKTIQRIGIERVAGLGLVMSGHPIVANSAHPNPTYKSIPIGGGWLLTPPSSTENKIEHLKKFDRLLGLGLSIEAIDRPDSDMQDDEGDQEDIETIEGNRKSWPSAIQVMFPDGDLIADRIAIKTLIQVIEHIGVEKVARLNIGTSAFPLLVRSARPRYGEIGGGWFLYSNTSTETKIGQIKQIGQRLGLELLVEIVERPKL